MLVVAFLRDGVPAAKVFSSMGTWFISVSVLLLFYVFGSYDITALVSARRVFARSLLALAMALAFIVLINYFGGKERSGVFGRGVLTGSFVSFALISSFVRLVIISSLKKTVQSARWLFVCTERIYRSLKADLDKNLFQGQRFFLLDQPHHDKDVLGTWQDYPDILNNSWDNIIIGFDQTAPHSLVEKLISVRFASVNVKDLVQFYEQQWRKIPIFALGTSWFLHTEGFSLFGNPIRVRLKRVIDLIVASLMLLMVWPLMLLTWICIRLESSGPAIYKQIRTGREGKDFTVLKFRSMRVDAEASGARWASLDDDRITRVGKFIRKTRIDELPQLFNILEGSMSLVGPRPERPEFNEMLKEKIPFYDFRHLIHPGLTGWAQVLYPYGASIEDAEEKLQYELFYIKNYSLWFDISIILKTVQVVIFGKGR